MVDTGRPPVDAVIQLRAVRAALRGAEQEMLRGFLTETIDEIGAVAGAPALVQRIQELIDGLGSDATSVPREDFSRDAPIGDSQP
jgi:DNA-binding FrmR family transcriptional regulator